MSTKITDLIFFCLNSTIMKIAFWRNLTVFEGEITMTIRDIAKAAGVSAATVSRIINHKDENISEETRRRVLQIIEEHEYVPYAKVRDRLLQSNRTIGVILPSLGSPFFASFIEHIQTLAASDNYTLSLYLTQNRPKLEEQAILHFLDIHALGILYFPESDNGIAALKHSQDQLRSAVLMDCETPEFPFPQVYRDFFNIAKTGTTALLKQNNRRLVLLLSGEGSFRVHEQLADGYREAMLSYGITPDDSTILKADDSFHTAFEQLTDAGIDGVICQNAYLTSEVYCIASRKHFLIPSDLSVLCLEDSISLEQLLPPVTAIRTDISQMAKTAYHTLLSQINAKKNVFPSQTAAFSLIQRRSIQAHKEFATKIMIAGSLNMDITLKVPHLPHMGETLLASHLDYWTGGKGANQAIGVSRFGANAYMLGRLGIDPYGRQLYEQLSNENVDMQGVSFVNSHPTGTAYITVQGNGGNTIVVNPGANATLTPSYVAENQALFSGVLYCLVQMEIPFPSVEKIFEICGQMNIKVILKPSPAQILPPAILQELFLLVPNQEEMAVLCPNENTPEMQARTMLSKGVQNVIVTLGDKGCIYVNHEGTMHFDAYPYPSVDSTGASDIFISCLAAQLANGCDMKKAIELSTLAASFSVSKEGVQNAILNREMLYDLYEKKFSISVNQLEE